VNSGSSGQAVQSLCAVMCSCGIEHGRGSTAEASDWLEPTQPA